MAMTCATCGREMPTNEAIVHEGVKGHVLVETVEEPRNG